MIVGAIPCNISELETFISKCARRIAKVPQTRVIVDYYVVHLRVLFWWEWDNKWFDPDLTFTWNRVKVR